MIVKFHARGVGRGSGPVDYLLGPQRDREGATLDRGDPGLIEALIDSIVKGQGGLHVIGQLRQRNRGALGQKVAHDDRRLFPRAQHRPRARLVPLSGVAGQRRFGGWEHELWIAPDFDDPLPDETLEAADGRRTP